jgi:hypothetical protein
VAAGYDDEAEPLIWYGSGYRALSDQEPMSREPMGQP